MKKTLQITSLLLFVFLFNQAPLNAQSWYGKGVVGEGAYVKETLDIDKFEAFHLTFSGNVYVKQGNRQEVVVEAQKNIIDLIKTEVKGGTWKIGFEKNVKKCKEVKVYITVPHLEGIHLSGSGDIQTEGTFGGLDDLAISVSGSGDIEADIEAQSITAKVSGSGDISLEGQTNQLSLQVSGSGDIECMDLAAQNCNVRVSGSGDCSVNAKESLEVRISGSGDVVYKGRPNLKSKISGSGDLTSKG